jgi:MarR family transcriptional regulator, lower aerobic nicotinate degradation pathway regulator
MSAPAGTKASHSRLRGGVARRWRCSQPNLAASAKASAGESPNLSHLAQRVKSEGGRESPGYRLEDQVGFILRRAHQRGSGIFNVVMDEFSITPTQFAALAKLHDLGSVSQNELGRLTAMDPATIWGVVSRLIKRGFVSQSMDASDARLVILELTDVGRDAAIAMKDVAAEVSLQTLKPLSEGEQGLFLRLLQRIAANGTTDE